MYGRELSERYLAFRRRSYAQATYYEELQEAVQREPTPWKIPPLKEMQIIERYRAMFPDAFMDRRKEMPRPAGEFGIEVFAGWLPIVEAMLEKLAGFGDIVIVQIKEKFGALTVYVGDPQSRDEVQAILRDARQLSVATCEFCGQPGKNQRMRDGWFKTMCDSCRAK